MPDHLPIERLRGPKEAVDPNIPYLFLNEQETDAAGMVRSVNTIFLTNKECPFRCVMCDLWKHTLDGPTPAGAIPRQIEYALERLPEASVVKLYNSGNFFDSKAIPPEDHPAIAGLLSGFDRVIVENHPKLCGLPCLEFSERLTGKLEIALGLETIHPEVLPRLNKQITVEDYAEAAAFLIRHNIDVRTFLLLNPPYLTDAREHITWTVRSAEFAFDHGSTACSIIPTRAGNGFMDKLLAEGAFAPSTLNALETAFEQALRLSKGRVFADLWDLEQFASCSRCFEWRKDRLHRMNLEQRILPPVKCTCKAD